MADEQITPELVNEMACNAICFQKNPLKTWVDVKKLDPNSAKYHENAWKYENPELFVLYETGKIVYDKKIYYMNEKTRNILLKTLKNQEKAAKRKELGQIIRYTIAVGSSIFAIVLIIHNVSNAVKSKQNKKEQQTEKVQSIKDSVPNNNDTIDFMGAVNNYKQAALQNQKCR